jgi:hypothetical protein
MNAVYPVKALASRWFLVLWPVMTDSSVHPQPPVENEGPWPAGWWKLPLCGLIVVVILGGIASYQPSGRRNADANSIYLTAAELLQSYNADPAMAQRQYSGKRVRIHGIADLVRADGEFFGAGAFVFMTSGSPDTIKGGVMLAATPAVIATLREHSPVTVECTISDYRMAPAPIVGLNGCSW